MAIRKLSEVHELTHSRRAAFFLAVEAAEEESLDTSSVAPKKARSYIPGPKLDRAASSRRSEDGADALGLDLGREDRGVTEHGLDEADVGASFEHERSHGVAEEVTGALPVDVGVVDDLPPEFGDPFGRERQVEASQEQRAVVGLTNEQVALRPRTVRCEINQ